MSDTFTQLSSLAAALSALAAVLSGYAALQSFYLSKKIRNELKSDEVIIFGTPTHPDLSSQKQASAVIQCVAFNKSKRKAFINSVAAFDNKNNPIAITWSNEIDGCGNTQNSYNLVGIIDSSELYIRRNDSENFNYARIEFMHSFSKSPATVVYDPIANWT